MRYDVGRIGPMAYWLALKIKRATSQGYRLASRTWKMLGDGFTPEQPERNTTRLTP